MDAHDLNLSLAESIDQTLARARAWIQLIAGLGLLVTLVNFAAVIAKVQFISDFTSEGSCAFLTSLSTLWVAIFGALVVLGLLQYAAAARLSRHVADQLTIPALLSVAQHAESGNRSLHTVLGDLEVLRNTLSSFAGRVIVFLLTTPVLSILTFTFHWAVGVTMACFCLLLAAASLALARAMAAEREFVDQNMAHSLGFMADAMRSGEAVLALGMLPRFSRAWASKSAEQQIELWRLGERAGWTSFFADLITSLLRGALLFVVTGLSLLGVVIAVPPGMLVLLARAAAPFATFGPIVEAWVAAAAAWRRLRRLAGAAGQRSKSAPEVAYPCPKGRLVAEHLSFTFGGRQPFLLRNIELVVEPGRIIGITGSSGSGKSTLLRLLLGIHRPSVGGAFLDGHATSQWDRRDLARHVGYLSQQPLLPCATVAEVIARLEVPDMAVVLEAARRAGAHEMIAGLPLGYATTVAGTYQFSRGQRHRLALARAIYGRPKLLLLDELASSLDVEGEAEVAALLAQLRREGTSVVFTTHRPGLLHLADRVYALRNKTLVPAGAEPHRLSRSAPAETRRLA